MTTNPETLQIAFAQNTDRKTYKSCTIHEQRADTGHSIESSLEINE